MCVYEQVYDELYEISIWDLESFLINGVYFFNVVSIQVG